MRTIIICAAVLATVGIWCRCIVSGRCSEEEPVYDDNREYSGLLTEED